MSKYSIVPEISDLIDRYSITPIERPTYAIYGTITSPSTGQTYNGIFAYTSIEFYSFLLKRELSKLGNVKIGRTFFHPDGQSDHLYTFLEQAKKRNEQQATF